jgi:Rrf2 family protein
LKISQKGLYALQATMTLARRHDQGAIKIREIAAESDLPEKFLELILLELKNARIVDSVRGAHGGYRLRRDPAQLPLSDIIRLIDGPLAPMGDAEQLRGLIAKGGDHRALYAVFLEVRDAAAKILENTTIADIVRGGKVKKGGGSRKEKSHRGVACRSYLSREWDISAKVLSTNRTLQMTVDPFTGRIFSLHPYRLGRLGCLI